MKQWQKYRSPELKTHLNKLTKDLKQLLYEQRNQGVQQYLKNLCPSKVNDYTLWKATRKLRQNIKPSPPIRKRDGSWARSNDEKAKTFAIHLSEVFEPNERNEETPEDDEDIHRAINETYQLELPIAHFTIRNVQTAIRNLKQKKAPGYDLITASILQELPYVGLCFLTYLFNSILRTSCFPPQWKVAQIIMISKPGKNPEETKSYRPISLLPIPSKLFERLLQKLMPIIEERKIIPDYQFGFRQKHATIEQIHRIVYKIFNDLEDKKYCTAAFLDISQAFDKVWHEGLLYKIKRALPLNYFTIMKSYLSERYFLVKYCDTTTDLFPIHSGVPQGSVLGPILYILYTADLPSNPEITLATFADDTAILASHPDPNVASQMLQNNILSVEKWLSKWRIKANSSKSFHVTFTNRKGSCPSVTLFGSKIPQADDVKYLGMHLDKHLNWRKHIFTKRKQLGLQLQKMYWLIGRKSQLSIENKILIYKAILKPVWTYGIQLWGTASTSNVEILQRFQSKVLRIIVDAPWYVTNDTLHRDLRIPTVREEIASCAIHYCERLASHPNSMASNLIKTHRVTRRLKRRIPQDLVLK